MRYGKSHVQCEFKVRKVFVNFSPSMDTFMFDYMDSKFSVWYFLHYRYGLDINREASDGYTVLLRAITFKHEENIIKFLIEKGAGNLS